MLNFVLYYAFLLLFIINNWLYIIFAFESSSIVILTFLTVPLTLFMNELLY